MNLSRINMKQWKKGFKNVLYRIGIISLITLSSCDKKKEYMPEKQVFYINYQGDFPSIHPHTGLDLGCRNIVISLFEMLFRIDENDQPQKALVDEYEISDSQLVYTFTLKKSTWNNGEPVTAKHFEKAWKKALSPDSPCLRPDLFYLIKNAQKAKKGEVTLDQVGIQVTDMTLRVELEHPAPYFLELLAHPIFAPIFDDQKEPTVFNGPFELAHWKRDEQMILQKNEHYWDKQNVFLDKIQISFVRDPSTALLLFEQGELDWLGFPFTQLPHDAMPYLQKQPEYHLKSVAGVYWLSLNNQKFPLEEKKIRQALSLCINRKEMAEKLLYGCVPTQTILPPFLSLLSKEENSCKQDQEKAKLYFEEGLQALNLTKRELPPLQILYSDIPAQKNIAQALQQVWQDSFGIRVELVNAEWNVFFSNLTKKTYQIGGCNWYASFSDPIYYLEFFKDLDNRYNIASWTNSEYSELVALAEKATNPEIRNSYLRQAEQMLLDETPVIPLFVHDYRFLVRKEITGAYLSNLGLMELKGIHKVKEASLTK